MQRAVFLAALFVESASGLPAHASGRPEIVVALQELGLQRFGKKCDGPDLAALAGTSAGGRPAAESARDPRDAPLFLQIDETDFNGTATEASLPDGAPGTEAGLGAVPDSSTGLLTEATMNNSYVPLILRDDEEIQGLAMATVVEVSPSEIPDRGPDVLVRRAGMRVIVGVAVVSSLVSVCIVLLAGRVLAPSHVAASTSRGNTATPGDETTSIFSCGSPDVEPTAGGNEGGGIALRQSVIALSVCRGTNISKFLPAAVAYDCALSRPVSSREILRFEGHVQVVAPSASLTSPLTRQNCVIYSATVSRQLHDGVPPVPVAFASANVVFYVALADGSGVRIELRGEDVSLFCVCAGRRVARQSLARAPECWQDFVLTHRITAPSADARTSCELTTDTNDLEFHECALLVGAAVTVVGELHRSSDGLLSLLPAREGVGWVAACCSGRVLTSDDPSLLSVPARMLSTPIVGEA